MYALGDHERAFPVYDRISCLVSGLWVLEVITSSNWAVILVRAAL